MFATDKGMEYPAIFADVSLSKIGVRCFKDPLSFNNFIDETESISKYFPSKGYSQSKKSMLAFKRCIPSIISYA